MDTLKVFAFVFCVLIHSGLKEVNAVDLSYTVVPSEVRRQGINQEDPCPGDTLDFVCILNGSSLTEVRWRLGATVITQLVSLDLGIMRNNAPGVDSILVNETFSALQIRLNELQTMIVMNGSVIGCEEVAAEVVGSRSRTLTIIGLASSPTVSVRNNSLSRLTVDMTAPDYGRECVDSYSAIAVISPFAFGPFRQQVLDPTQDMYTLVIPRLDLCRDNFTSVTAYGVTDGREGAMATPVTVDNIDRTTIITSEVSSFQLFNSSGVNFVLSWQVIDEGILPNGFQVECFKEDNPISCAAQGTTVTQSTVVIPYSDDLIGANITFNVNYSYDMCMSDSFSTSLRVVNLLVSDPAVFTDERAVVVIFNAAVLDSSASEVMFLSNCTDPTTVALYDFQTYVQIPIPEARPDIRFDDSQCRYTIQLMDGRSRPIGPPITGVFNITGLPTTMTPETSGNNGAAIGGGIGGAIAAVAAATSVVIAVVVVSIVYKKKKEKGGGKRVDTRDSGEDNTDAKVDLATYADPNSSEHQQAPSGEENALVDRGGNFVSKV